MPQDTSTPIFSRDGRPCGFVRADHIFYRRITSKQVLQRPPALALEVSILDQLTKAGCERIQITNADDGTIYTTTFEHFQRSAFKINYSGFGEQRALPLGYWIRQSEGAQQLTLFPAREAAR